MKGAAQITIIPTTTKAIVFLAVSLFPMSVPLVMKVIPAKTRKSVAIAVAIYLMKL